MSCPDFPPDFDLIAPLELTVCEQCGCEHLEDDCPDCERAVSEDLLRRLS